MRPYIALELCVACSFCLSLGGGSLSLSLPFQQIRWQPHYPAPTSLASTLTSSTPRNSSISPSPRHLFLNIPHQKCSETTTITIPLPCDFPPVHTYRLDWTRTCADSVQLPAGPYLPGRICSRGDKAGVCGGRTGQQDTRCACCSEGTAHVDGTGRGIDGSLLLTDGLQRNAEELGSYQKKIIGLYPLGSTG